MKKIGLVLAASFFMFSCGTEATTDSKSEKESSETKKETKSIMGIGTENPSLEAKLMDVSGTEMHLEELGKKNGMLLIFSCNTCPFVVGRGEDNEGWENRYNDIQKIADELEIGFALINSNEGKRSDEDSFDNMVSHANENNYNEIKYLMDTDSEVANAFNAKTTPHVFLFDNQNKLVYTGAIDDNVKKKEEVTEKWLANAMNELAQGKEISKPITENKGCSIKRVKKEEGH